MPSHKNKGKQQQPVAESGADVITFTTDAEKDVQWAQTFFTAEGATDEDACLPPADLEVTVQPLAVVADSPPAPPVAVASAAAIVPAAADVNESFRSEEIRLLRQQLEQQNAMIQMLLSRQAPPAAAPLPAPVVPVAPVPVVVAPRAVPSSAPSTPSANRGRVSAFRSKVPALPNQSDASPAATPVHVDHIARLRNSTAKTSTGSLRQKDVQGKRTPTRINFRDEIKLGSTYTTKGFGGLV
jgi:hypothetical protein